MIFANSIGSSGTKDELFSLYLPLILSPGRNISIDEKKYEHEVQGRTFTIEKHNHLYSLKIFPFHSYNEAQEYIGNVLASIHWISLKHKTGIKIPSELAGVKLFKEPSVVTEKSHMYEMVKEVGWSTLDGYYDVNKLVIIPEQKHLSRSEMGKATVTLGFGPDNFISDLVQSLNYPSINKVMDNKKLCLAIELYSSFSFEVTDTGKFIRLVTVLESLLPETEIAQDALDLLIKTKGLMKAERKVLQASGQNVEAINHLISRLGNLSKQSIGQSISSYVSGLSQSLSGFETNGETIPTLQEAYNIRSRLLHDGEYDESSLKNSLNVLSKFIPELLLSLFEDCANNVEL